MSDGASLEKGMPKCSLHYLVWTPGPTKLSGNFVHFQPKCEAIGGAEFINLKQTDQEGKEAQKRKPASLPNNTVYMLCGPPTCKCSWLRLQKRLFI